MFYISGCDEPTAIFWWLKIIDWMNEWNARFSTDTRTNNKSISLKYHLRLLNITWKINYSIHFKLRLLYIWRFNCGMLGPNFNIFVAHVRLVSDYYVWNWWLIYLKKYFSFFNDSSEAIRFGATTVLFRLPMANKLQSGWDWWFLTIIWETNRWTHFKLRLHRYLVTCQMYIYIYIYIYTYYFRSHCPNTPFICAVQFFIWLQITKIVQCCIV